MADRIPRERTEIVTRIKTLAGELKTLSDDLNKLPDTGKVSYGSRLSQWGPHITHLARSCGNAVSVARPLFSALPFGGQDLHDQDTVVHDLGDIMVLVEGVFEGMTQVYNGERVKLMNMTFMVVDQVTALHQLPMPTAEQQGLLALVYPPIEHILAERNEKVQSARKSGQKLKRKGAEEKAQVEAKVKLAEAETKVLRGGKLSLPPGATPARKTKRG